MNAEDRTEAVEKIVEASTGVLRARQRIISMCDRYLSSAAAEGVGRHLEEFEKCFQEYTAAKDNVLAVCQSLPKEA